ncbi:hypothetical protein FRC06_003473 [Ceratobasidium sp. 370]|nr:hypothetical protein FRC06_003473 [Ceratobasidium sp. 370]
MDGGRKAVDVEKHTSDHERVALPLQWAVDKAVMQHLGINISDIPTPQELIYSQESNEESRLRRRLSYLAIIETLLVFVFFFAFVGIVYQLSGAFVDERASRLASLMHVMGCTRGARMLSWHFSLSLVYLPAWIVTAAVWHYRIFTKTNVGLLIAIHIITGLSLASFSLVASMPFRKSPQLGAIATTFLTVLLSIIALLIRRSPAICAVYTLIFPPGFFVLAIKAVSRFERDLHGAQVGAARGASIRTANGARDGRILGSVLGVAVINIFLWLMIAGIVERWMFEPGAGNQNVESPHRGSWFSRFLGVGARSSPEPPPPDPESENEPHTPIITSKSHPLPPAITLTNLTKTFPPTKLRAPRITAVENLSLSIPARGIFVLLGANGSGKSTTLEMIAGLERPSVGAIEFGAGGDNDQASERGDDEKRKKSLGFVPQRNVLLPELTCYQTVRLWRDIKLPSASPLSSSSIPLETSPDLLEQLLDDCDLHAKMHAPASTLSGGQKRRLQLACGLVGGGKVVLVDEATSGVDPLSRRAIWRALGKVREGRCVVFTTHFLDEADLLADDIAILAAPGKLLAQGSPVALKSKLGKGYVVHVTRSDLSPIQSSPDPILSTIRTDAPLATPDGTEPGAYILHSRDPQVVGRVLNAIEERKGELGVGGYDVRGTTMEAIFLELMGRGPNGGEVPEQDEVAAAQSPRGNMAASVPREEHRPLGLSDGQKMSPLCQAFTGFRKRALIFRRSWLSYALMVVIAVTGACVPLIFLKDRTGTCNLMEDYPELLFLYLPDSASEGYLSTLDGNGREFNASQLIISPPDLLSVLREDLPQTPVSGVDEFIHKLEQAYRTLSLGGLEVHEGQQATIAWEASPASLSGLRLLNLASNVLADGALNTTGPRIRAYFQSLPITVLNGTDMALKWEGFFGASMALWPAFSILYVSAERRSSIQAMQLSNGMVPAGLWLGHLLFDLPWVELIATIVVVVFGTATSQFYALGAWWAVIVLYGIAGVLFAYVVSTFVKSPLAGFALAGGYNVIMSVLYSAACLLTLAYTRSSDSSNTLMAVYYTMSLVSPVTSIVRTAFVSVNLFAILCNGLGDYSPSSPSSMSKFGGPIVYLINWILILFALLMWIEYGKPLPKRLQFRCNTTTTESNTEMTAAQHGAFGAEVNAEAKRVQTSKDALRMLNVTKTFPGRFTAVDDVSFGVDNEIFAMVGPNGAGKTTTFNIRGVMRPTKGDVTISGVSIVDELAAARVSLGVTPQFSAADSQLTVREHMMIYGSLKGENLERNVELLMEATTLSQYRDRLASKLSGGNARKLSLALALLGNPRVLLIDEYSTGIDPATKRAMWETLRRVSPGKAVVITTHSMEEASALASQVGILSKRMLAIGTPHSLVSHFQTYEVHFTARTSSEASRASALMARFPGSRKADDVETRYEVPIGRTSLAALFDTLSSSRAGGQDIGEDPDLEYTVERLGLESVFLKVIREHNAAVEDEAKAMSWWRFW